MATKQASNDISLKQGTLTCPCHKERLEFEQIHGMRLIQDNYLNARCAKTKTHFKVKA